MRVELRKGKLEKIKKQLNEKMNQISKELRQFLIENAITIIVESLPAKLNCLVEKDSSE